MGLFRHVLDGPAHDHWNRFLTMAGTWEKFSGTLLLEMRNRRHHLAPRGCLYSRGGLGTWRLGDLALGRVAVVTVQFKRRAPTLVGGLSCGE
jgi:hypothetical protein